MRHLFLSVLTVLLVVSTSSGAMADKSEREAAEQFFRAGERAFDAGQYDAAAQAFEEAYTTLPLPAIAFSAAQSHRLQFFIDKDATRLKRAIDLYRLYLREVPSGGRRQDAVTGLSDLEPTLLRLEAENQQTGGGPIASRPVATAETRFMMSSQIAGATATVDGGAPNATPAVVQVTPGSHTVLFQAEGYFPVEKSVVALENQLLPVEATLEPMPARVDLKTEKGAEISVDGRPVGESPVSAPLEVEEGRHVIGVRKNGRRAWSQEIDLSRGEELTIAADLHTTTQRRLSYWILGSSALTLTVAGVFGGLALSADGNANDILGRTETETLSPQDLDEYEGYREQRDNRRRTAYVLAGVGGSMALAGALLYFLDTPTNVPTSSLVPSAPRRGVEKPSLTFAPILSDRVTGVGVASRF